MSGGRSDLHCIGGRFASDDNGAHWQLTSWLSMAGLGWLMCTDNTPPPNLPHLFILWAPVRSIAAWSGVIKSLSSLTAVGFCGPGPVPGRSFSLILPISMH